MLDTSISTTTMRLYAHDGDVLACMAHLRRTRPDLIGSTAAIPIAGTGFTLLDGIEQGNTASGVLATLEPAGRHETEATLERWTLVTVDGESTPRLACWLTRQMARMREDGSGSDSNPLHSTTAFLDDFYVDLAAWNVAEQRIVTFSQQLRADSLAVAAILALQDCTIEQWGNDDVRGMSVVNVWRTDTCAGAQIE